MGHKVERRLPRSCQQHRIGFHSGPDPLAKEAIWVNKVRVLAVTVTVRRSRAEGAAPCEW